MKNMKSVFWVGLLSLVLSLSLHAESEKGEDRFEPLEMGGITCEFQGLIIKERDSKVIFDKSVSGKSMTDLPKALEDACKACMGVLSEGRKKVLAEGTRFYKDRCLLKKCGIGKRLASIQVTQKDLSSAIQTGDALQYCKLK